MEEPHQLQRLQFARPHSIQYALSETEMLIAVELRKLTWWSLDEITAALNSSEPKKVRSAVYRTFVRQSVNRVPEKEKAKNMIRDTSTDFFGIT